MSEVKQQLLNKELFICALIGDIFLYALSISILTHSIRIEPTCPKFASPQKFLYIFVLLKYFARCYTFDSCYYSGYRHRRNTLYQKMHMVFIHTYLYKVYFETTGYIKANLTKSCRHLVCENRSSIFRWKDKMIQQQGLVMSF